MYKARIAHLKESQRVLDERIIAHERDRPNTENQLVQEWKNQQLAFKNEIRRLERLQWEHDHETVNFDDDR